MIELITNSS